MRARELRAHAPGGWHIQGLEAERRAHHATRARRGTPGGFGLWWQVLGEHVL
jgi:hypothetical protein